MRTHLAIGLGLAIVAGACSQSGSGPVAAPGPDIVELDDDDVVLVSELIPFNSCAALLDHLQQEAIERVGPYGLDQHGYGPWPAVAEDVAQASAEGGAVGDDEANSAAPAPAGTPVADSGGDPDRVAGTNIQELGVDEPDIIKTDGKRILTISEGTLSSVDLSSGEAVLTDQLRIGEGWSHELFFEGDRAFVFTNGSAWGTPLPGGFETSTVTDGIDAEAEFAVPVPVEPFPQGPTATIIEIDLSDLDDLRVRSTLRIQGEYLSARRVGDTVRLALTSPPTQLPFVYPAGPAGEELAEETNREIIAGTDIDDWIPQFEYAAPDRTAGGNLVDCARMHRPASFSGFDVVSVLSFDLGAGVADSGSGVGVLAGGRTVYASTDRFYVATSEWADVTLLEGDSGRLEEWEDSYTTDVHAFSIDGNEPADYLASGSVSGTLLNQFSMDEHDGYLRLVTTDGSPWGGANTSATTLTVLEERNDELVPVGRVGGLGKGEQLYAARLLDDVGFAVTFRQIDPFYVLDLRDPTDPVVAGELKIPGFSTYLHPIDDDLVLGIGQDATAEGRVTGLKVSLFDVSDPADPAELAVWTLPDATSAVEHDHRAFQYLPDDRVAILPVESWRDGFNGAVFLEIGDETITERARVTHERRDGRADSDCESLEPASFPEDTELFWIARDGAHVQYCEAGDVGGWGDRPCEPIPLDELRRWGDEEVMDALIAGFAGDDPAPGGRIEICWPDDGDWIRQIHRSVVIGDDVWTLSWSTLQANHLTDGTLEDRVEL